MKLPGPLGQQVELRAQPDQARLSPGQQGARYETAIAGGERIATMAGRALALENEHRAVIQSTKAIAQARNDLTAKLLEAQKQAPPGAAGFAGTFSKTVQDYSDQLLKDPQNSDPMVQRYLTQRMAALSGELGEHALAFEAQSDLAKRQDDLQQTVNLQANTIRTDASQYEGALGEALGAVRASGLPASKLPAAEAHVRDTLSTAYIQGLNENNPALAKKELDSGRFDAAFALGRKDQLLKENQQQQDRLQAQADKAQREQQAAFRARVDGMYADEQSSIRDRGTGLGQLTPAMIRASRPDDPDGAQLMIDRLDRDKAAYNTMTSHALTPLEADKAALAAAQPQGADYADQQQNRDNLQHALNAKWAAIEKDPASYVANASPQLQAAWQAASSDPSKIRDAVALSDNLQAGLGLAPEQRRLFPEEMAKQQAAKITALPPDQAAATLTQMASVYQNRFPQALAEMKLPPAYQVLATSDGPGRNALVEALKQGPKSLDDLAGDNSTAIKKALPGAMGDFLKTITAAPNGGPIADAWQNAVQMTALRYATQGADPATAVKTAYANLIASHYDLASAPGYNARAPKGTLPQVEAYADNLLGTLKPGDVAPPPRAAGETPLTDAQRQEAYFRDGVQSGAQWVTSPADDGWLLLDAARRPVTRGDGSPVSFSFSQAMQAPPPQAAPPSVGIVE